MKYSKQETADQLTNFRRMCPPGTKVYAVLRSVSRSGMSRQISLIAEAPGTDHKTYPNWAGAVLTQSPHKTGFNDSIRVDGCGMDMGLSLVDSLSYAAYGVPCHQGRVDANETAQTIIWAGWL